MSLFLFHRGLGSLNELCLRLGRFRLGNLARNHRCGETGDQFASSRRSRFRYSDAHRGPGSKKIETIQEWETKRDRILEVLKQMIGEPTDLERVPPYTQVLGKEDAGRYMRHHLKIATEPEDWIPAYLLIPKDLPEGPNPAMIVLHQTVSQGKDEPAGIEGSDDMDFAAELVERGFICLVPDVIGFGERTPEGAPPYTGAHDFYKRHPNWSFFGKMIWDFQQCVNFLETLPEVDPRRIGSIGHSHGAYGTIMCSIFEPRISAAVASCGFNTLRTDPDPNRWSRLTALLPRLEFYVQDIKSAPFDWHEVIACMAPRPYFNWATLEDQVFPNTDNLASIYEEMKEVYSLYGARDDFQGRLVPGKHRFPEEGREQAYAFLQQHLPKRPNLDAYRIELPSSQEEWETHSDQVKQLILRDIGSVDPPITPAEVKEISREAKEGYEQVRLEYEIDGGVTVAAYLLVPDNLEGEHPGIIAFHQTTEEGKNEPAGLAGRESLHFGTELVRRGYVVLIPDSITAGERIDPPGAFHTAAHYRRHSNTSAMGKMIQDGRVAISVLQSFDFVDGDRIGTIGHSLGAEESLFVAAFDDRVKAAVASCGYAPLAVEKKPDRWARDHWFSYIPKWRIDLRAGRKPAWDFDAAMSLIAPRGYFNFQTSEDQIFEEGKAADAMTLSLMDIWSFLGAPENLRSRLDPGEHDINEDAREEVYEWMDKILLP
ncbi:MAG: dienelactone hydrolase family protein [Candidatus Omnitrophica bacterium]|nr:dienelactone hydrolase family protein [Candidatus Omnitrophota bacterium]